MRHVPKTQMPKNCLKKMTKMYDLELERTSTWGANGGVTTRLGEAAGSSTRGSGWPPSGPASAPWERRTAQGCQGRPEEALIPSSGTAEG